MDVARFSFFDQTPDAQVALDARSLIEACGKSAYDEARTLARDARLGTFFDANRPAGHWDLVRREIARLTGVRSDLDTATRYLSR